MSKKVFLDTLRSFSRWKNMMVQQSSRILPQRPLCATSQNQGNILYSAVCVERLPVITQEKTKVERSFAELSQQMEVENSLLSDHELQVRTEKQKAQKRKEMEEEEEVVAGATETVFDLVDKWVVDFKTFTPAARLTEADEKNDVKSLDRQLDSSLYLLVRQNIAGRGHWILPQATWKEGETMRETAERALASVCGEVNATFLGNAPSAVAKYEPDEKDKEQGIKLFFYKAWYNDGQVTPNSEFADDYMWVTKEELSKYCFQGYRQNLKKIM